LDVGGHQIHLQHSTPDVAHIAASTSTSSSQWLQRTRATQAKCARQRSWMSIEACYPYRLAHRHEANRMEALATDQAPHQRLRLIPGVDVLRRQECIRPQPRVQRSFASHAWVGEDPSPPPEQVASPPRGVEDVRQPWCMIHTRCNMKPYPKCFCPATATLRFYRYLGKVGSEAAKVVVESYSSRAPAPSRK